MLSSRCIVQLAHMAISGPNNPFVRVYIKSTNIGNDGAAAFGYALQNNPTLAVLVLNDCGISSEGCKALADGLRDNNTALRRLNLDRNAIGDDGMSASTSVDIEGITTEVG